MDQINPQTAWAVIIALLTFALLLLNVWEKISSVKSKAKEPGNRQDERLTRIEGRIETIERKLENDDNRLKDIKKGDHAMQKALLALLDHGIDGNNIKQMEDAKEELNNYLIEK